MIAAVQSYSLLGHVGYAVADLPRDVLIRLVKCPEFPLHAASTETVKDGDGVLVSRTQLPCGDRCVDIAYKRVERITLLKRLTQTVGPNRARQAFFAGHRLLDHGIATARPLAVVVPSRFATTAPSWLATEWVVDAVDLAAFTAQCSSTAVKRPRKSVDAVAVAVGRLIGRMHAAGITHRDLKPQNLMIRCGSRPDDVEVIAVDLDGIRFPGRISERRRWKNLSRLAIGDSGRGWPGIDRAVLGRFLAAYLEAAGLSISCRTAWQRLSAVTAARLARRAA